eukprot:m.67862 g.67862  ORF g.67862 m.67862 type:complete len:837 (-) comp23881_c0_seq1:68-2578(-)
MLPSAARIAKFLQEWKISVIIFWVLALAGSGYFAPKLLTDTTMTFLPPPLSDAAKATTAFNEVFPVQAHLTNLVILVSTTDGSDVRNSSLLKNLSIELNTSLTRKYGDFIWGDQVQSYYGILEQGAGDPLFIEAIEALADQFISRDKGGGQNRTSTMMVVVVRADETSFASINFANNLRTWCTNWQKRTHGGNNVSIDLDGMPAMITAITESAERDLEMMDGIILPIALFILALVVGSFRLLIVPVMALAFTAALSFATIDGITRIHPIISSTPSLMMSVFLAMSIDYSMFLLTRFKLEIKNLKGEQINPQNMHAIVTVMLNTSGRVIFASGSTLTFCFLGLIALPLAVIQSLGIGCAVSLVYAVAINLTLCPAMLFTFPLFFSRTCSCKRGGGNTVKSAEAEPLFKYNNAQSLNDDMMQTEIEPPPINCWSRVARFTQTKAGSLVILVVVGASVIPFGLNAFNAQVDAGMDQYVPRGGESARALTQLAEDFSPGTTYPYSLMIEMEDDRYGGSVLNESFVDTLQDMLARFSQNSTLLPNSTMLASFVQIGDLDIPAACIAIAMNNGSKWDCPPQFLPMIKSLVLQYTNADFTASYVQIMLGIPPLQQVGSEWLVHFRKHLEVEAQTLGFKIHLVGFAADVLDSVTYVYGDWGLMVMIVSIAVVIVVVICFRSIVVALRGVITIAITFIFVSGFAKLVYCDMVFNSWGFAGFTGNGSISWIIPPTVFPLVVGIALDYDIFLLGRVVEWRERGVTTTEAIVNGVASTGNIITAAGVIQSLAFFGLLLSNEPMLNQLSFYLFFAVLFDTFIIRTLVVPSLMFWLGDVNWWPRKMPASS